MPPFASILLSVLLIAAAQPDGATATATVNRVIDGDTLDAQLNGVRTPVGLLGAQAPALNAACGAEAAARLTELADNTVVLQSDPAAPGLDERRRVPFYAFTQDGVSIDETLISEGLAHARGDTFAASEADARDNARGCLWS